MRLYRHLENGIANLVNRHTVVFTDHQPLKYFMSQPKLSARQECWLDFLADFYFDVQYKPGVQNILLYTLSRLPPSARDVLSIDCAYVLSMILEPSWLFKVHEGQQADEQLAQFLIRASSNDSEFILRTVHLLSLLYQCPKNSGFQLVIPFENGLCQLLL